MFDYRVEYWPSVAYRRQLDGGNVNVAEDYSGETYLLAYHLGSIHSLTRVHGEKIAVLESQIAAQGRQLERIDHKLDRILEHEKGNR